MVMFCQLYLNPLQLSVQRAGQPPLPPASCYSMSAHVHSSCLHTRTDWHLQHLLTCCQAECGCVSRCFPAAQPGAGLGKPLGFQGQQRVREVGQGGRPERAAGARALCAAALKVFFTPRSDSCTYLRGEPCRSRHEEKRKICRG